MFLPSLQEQTLQNMTGYITGSPFEPHAIYKTFSAFGKKERKNKKKKSQLISKQDKYPKWDISTKIATNASGSTVMCHVPEY